MATARGFAQRSHGVRSVGFSSQLNKWLTFPIELQFGQVIGSSSLMMFL